MVRCNFLMDKLNSGKVVIGTWIILPSLSSLDVIASAGLDFVILDSEHGPLGFEKIQEMVMVCESRNVSPVVRVSGLREDEILKALDVGAHGVQVPNVLNLADVQSIVDFSKYPPVGKRGFSPFTRSGEYGGVDRKQLTTDVNSNSLIVVNIEGVDALINLDLILTNENIDVIFVGLYDLSKSMGVPGDIDNPLVQEKLKEIVEKVNRSGKKVGTIASSENDLKKYSDMGMTYLVYLVDATVLRDAYSGICQVFKEHVKNG